MNEQMEKRLVQANELREQEQYSESAKLYIDCLADLVGTNDYVALIHCLSGQSLIYKILNRNTNSPIYRNLTLAYAKEAYAIAEEHPEIEGRALSIAYSSYGDALLIDKKFAEALPLFEKSLSVSTADVPEKGRLKAHLGNLKYLLGDKDAGISLIKESLVDIRTGDLSTYAIRVWETGAINELAKIYAKEGNLEDANKLAQESLQIATDHNLSIRKRDAEDIIAKISSGSTDFSL